MMHPLFLNFLDGTTFFVGLTAIVAGELLLVRFRRRLVQLFLALLAVAGILLVLASSTPMSAWAYVVFTAVSLVGLLVIHVCRPSARFVAAMAVAVTCIALCIAEMRFLRIPSIEVPKGAVIYVIGDSISAGINDQDRCWPEMLEAKISRRVINLAEPGATIESAYAQVERINEKGSPVIVEIGGNDLLIGRDPGTFHDQLEVLVSRLRANDHQVLLMELPLFPFQNAFGQAQRDVARKHGAALLPKRCFTKVLGAKDATLDGLHLSQKGHGIMASIVAGVIQRNGSRDARPPQNRNMPCGIDYERNNQSDYKHNKKEEDR